MLKALQWLPIAFQCITQNLNQHFKETTWTLSCLWYYFLFSQTGFIALSWPTVRNILSWHLCSHSSLHMGGSRYSQSLFPPFIHVSTQDSHVIPYCPAYLIQYISLSHLLWPYDFSFFKALITIKHYVCLFSHPLDASNVNEGANFVQYQILVSGKH